MFDIWRERWYEPARYPEESVSLRELREHSEWNEALGIRVLSLAYLIAQRERSVTFIEEKSTLDQPEKARPAKDRADFSVLRPLA